MITSLRPKEYVDCQYSLFMSYAHKDDTTHNGWVGALRDAIWDRLHILPGDVPRLTIHFSQENGPSAGHLGGELRERLECSFAMLLVVGNAYVESKWCERELELFMDIFGKDATRSRLFVVVMSKAALDSVSKGALWREVVAPDQVWVNMYQEMNPNRPIRAQNDLGRVTQSMHERCLGMVDRLAEQIMASVAKQKVAPPRKVPPNAVSAGASADRLQVLIGPCTPNLSEKVVTLKEALERSGAAVTVLDRSVIDDFDPDAEYPLGGKFAAAHTLVLPFTDIKPLKPDKDGGHVALLAEEWAKLNRSKQIIWYRPAEVTVDESERAATRHLDVFKRFEPVYASPKAVVNHLFSTGNTLRVYIEKHRHEPAYWLTKEIDDAWKALPPEQNRPLMLDYSFIELGDLQSIADDAAGIVLLMPEGIKDQSSLYAQIESVRRTFPRRGLYPGVVVCIFNPPPGERPGLRHDWAEVHIFRSSQDAGKFEVDEASKRWLAEFVRHLWVTHKQQSLAPIH